MILDIVFCVLDYVVYKQIRTIICFLSLWLIPEQLRSHKHSMIQQGFYIVIILCVVQIFLPASPFKTFINSLSYLVSCTQKISIPSKVPNLTVVVIMTKNTPRFMRRLYTHPIWIAIKNTFDSSENDRFYQKTSENILITLAENRLLILQH